MTVLLIMQNGYEYSQVSVLTKVFMMRYRYLFPVFLILLFFTLSCEYNLKDEYYKDTKRVDSANIQILLDPQANVYFLAGINLYNFEVLTSGLTLYQVKVYVDTTEIQVSPLEELNYFTLDCRNYTNGSHTLTVEVITNSNSGSLADLVGAEGFIYSYSWQLIVDSSPPSAVQISKIYDAGGILKIEWSRYNQPNFWKYEILKSAPNIVGTLTTTSLAYIEDPAQNFFYDSSFVGGTADYFVRVLTPMYQVSTSNILTFNDGLPDFKVEWIKDNNVKISWNRCNYDAAFSSYTIKAGNSDQLTINNINQTSVMADYGILGKKINYNLRVNSIRSNITGRVYPTVIHEIGIPFMKFDQILKNSVNNDILVANKNKLYRYNTVSGHTEDSTTVSNNNPVYIYSPADDVLLLDSPRSKIDPVTFAVTPLSWLNFSSDNLSLSSYGLADAGSGMVLYDFKNLNSKGSLSFPGDYKKYITEDNTHILEHNGFNMKCYDIENGQINMQWQGVADDFRLIPGSPELMITYFGYSVLIKNILTNETIRTLDVFAYGILDVDPVNKLVMVYAYDYPAENVMLFNYETGLHMKTIKGISAGLKIKNGVIYSKSGYTLPIL